MKEYEIWNWWGRMVAVVLCFALPIAGFIFQHELFHAKDEIWIDKASMQVRNLPAGSITTSVGMIPGKGYFVIWQPAESKDEFRDFRVNMGRGHELRKVEVTEIGKLRCAGGTIKTPEGTFRFEADHGCSKLRLTFNDIPTIPLQ